MITIATESTPSDLAFARKAGLLHGQLLAALGPWVEADDTGRRDLLGAALKQLCDSGQIDHNEHGTMRQTFDLLDRPATTQPAFLDHLSGERRKAESRSASAMMILFLGIGHDSASRSMGAATKADMVGALIGGAWGLGGALAGATALSLLEQSSTPAY